MSLFNRMMAAVAAAALLSTFALNAQAQDPAPAGEAPAAETPAVPDTEQQPGVITQEQEDAAAAVANQVRDPAIVVAKVGDQTVTEGEVALAREAFSAELANVPQDQWRSVLVDAVINIKLMAMGAREAGLDKGPDFERKLEFLRLQALRNIFIDHSIVSGVSDADLQAAYQTLVVSQHKPEQQVHARHILVDTKEQAEKIIADLKGGASFEELAKQSKDPSGQNGGDLGFFGPGQMVPPFEQAAFALEAGQTTEQPVQSEYGWHVIKVEEKRMSEAPPFDEVKEELRNYVLRQKFEQVVASLRDKYAVEILDASALPASAPAEGTADPAAPMDGAAPPVEEPAPGEDPTAAPAN